MQSDQFENNTMISFVSEIETSSPEKRKGLINRFIAAFHDLGVPVTHIGVTGKKNYVSYARGRKYIETMDWAGMDNVSLMHFKPERNGATMAFEFTAEANVTRCRWLSLPRQDPDPVWPYGYERWRTTVSVDLIDAGGDRARVLEKIRALGCLTVENYGYSFAMPRNVAPFLYASGSLSAKDGRSDVARKNIQGWRSQSHFHWTLLRDVYPYNFLTRPYLDLRVFGTTLGHWIRADASRGNLEALNENVTLWKPVYRNIPAIREALFRQGILYYWAYYRDPITGEPMGPRMLQPSEPVPEIFRADTYAKHDPALAYFNGGMEEMP